MPGESRRHYQLPAAWERRHGSMALLLAGRVLLVLAGTPGFALSAWPRAAALVGAGGTVASCILALFPTLRVLTGGLPESAPLTWDAAHGAFSVELDALSAFFLFPVLLLSALASVYGSDYLFAFRQRQALGVPRFFFD